METVLAFLLALLLVVEVAPPEDPVLGGAAVVPPVVDVADADAFVVALAAAGTAAAAIAMLESVVTRARDPHSYLFRRPAGLADGLALKEPAPPTDSPRDSPQQLGSPAP